MLVGVTKVKSELEKESSSSSRVLHFAHAGLNAFPSQLLFSNSYAENATKLVRLDLSWNNLQSLPGDICKLVNLRELWLHNNPQLSELPKGMRSLEKLEVLDIRNTSISVLPPELVTLSKLYEIDWRETPLAESLQSEHDVAVNDLPALQDLLLDQFTRSNLEAQLLEILQGTHFAKEADKPNMAALIRSLVQTLSDMYADLVDFKLFVRSADNLLPEKMADINAASLQRTKDDFKAMQRGVHRQRLSADVEIKLRNIYFDRAERQHITAMLDGIYASVASLEDIQFLVKYATQILPPDPATVTGPLVWERLLALQQELTDKREGAIATLRAAMMGLYPEQRPEAVEASARAVAAAFRAERFATKKELLQLAQLTGEAAKLLPPDFLSVSPAEAYEAWRALFKGKK